MAKRRSRKSSSKLQKRWQRLRKRFSTLPKSLVPHFAHSSVFVIGIAIGLAVGLAIGLGIVWLDGRRHPALAPTQVAEIAAPKPAAPVPPAYVEETEPAQDEAEQDEAAQDESGAAAPTAPPMLSEAPLPAETPPPPPAPAPPEPRAASPAAPAAEEPAWVKNAVASIDPGGKPVIAIVLDDVGAAPGDVAGAVALPAPITLSIMTYAPNAPRVAAAAQQAGHEIMVHVPMEAINRDADPGKNALLTGLSEAEIRRRLDWDLSQFQGYVGINNHMGSRFTQDAAGMTVVLQALKARGLLFLDSRTIASSVGDRLAGQIGITHLKRDVFLDNVIDEADIRKELARAETIARKQGFAIAIGHPHPDTVEALRQWIPEAKARGFVLVPISTIARKQLGVTG